MLTRNELQAIHHSLFHVGWQEDTFYAERRNVLKKIETLLHGE